MSWARAVLPGCWLGGYSQPGCRPPKAKSKQAAKGQASPDSHHHASPHTVLQTPFIPKHLRSVQDPAPPGRALHTKTMTHSSPYCGHKQITTNLVAFKHKCVISQSRDQRSGMASMGLKSRYVQMCSFPEALRENLLPTYYAGCWQLED